MFSYNPTSTCGRISPKCVTNSRKKEARQPRTPMVISEETFKLIVAYLKAVGFDGPVGISVDDSVLLKALRLVWNGDEGAYYLVGGVDGPIRVLNPEDIERIMNDPDIVKGSKVRRNVV